MTVWMPMEIREDVAAVNINGSKVTDEYTADEKLMYSGTKIKI